MENRAESYGSSVTEDFEFLIFVESSSTKARLKFRDKQLVRIAVELVPGEPYVELSRRSVAVLATLHNVINDVMSARGMSRIEVGTLSNSDGNPCIGE